MAVYDLNNPKDYLRFFKDIERFKENKHKIEIKKFHPVQTDSQQRYIHFMISYWANLRETRNDFCCPCEPQRLIG